MFSAKCDFSCKTVMEPDVILLNIVLNSNVGDGGGAEPHFAIASSRSLIACWTIPATSCVLTRLFLSSAFSCCSKMFWRRKELRSEHCGKLFLSNKNMCICLTHNDCLNKKTQKTWSLSSCAALRFPQRSPGQSTKAWFSSWHRETNRGIRYQPKDSEIYTKT